MSTSMFGMSSKSCASPKLNFSHAELSSKYLDPSQLPTKGVPFRQIGAIPLIKHVRICMPVSVRKSLYSDGIEDEVARDGRGPFPSLRHVKVNMTFKDILDDENLRRGNYLFLSSSKHPSSNSTSITLDCGKVTIEMPLHVYQRTGLAFPVSKVPGGGCKHDPRSARHRIETDLRQPNMVKGKKAFDRLMYAAKNVEGLNQPRPWLFCDLSAIPGSNSSSSKKRKRDGDNSPALSSDTGCSQSALDSKTDSSDEHPLSKFNPSVATTGGVFQTSSDVMIPSFVSSPKFMSTIPLQATNQQMKKASTPTILEEDIYDIAEYFSLVFLQSPRITKAEYGRVDPYLCQYTLPNVSFPSRTNGDSESNSIGVEETDSVSMDDLNTTSYSGLIPSSFVTQLFVDVIRRSRSIKTPQLKAGAWFAVNIIAHQTNVSGSLEGLTILLQAAEETGTNASSGDITMADAQPSSSTTEEGMPKDASPEGFQFATCFEFVDSLTG